MKKRKKSSSGGCNKDISNKTVLIMLVIVVVVSILSLVVYMNALEEVKLKSIDDQLNNVPQNEAKGKVFLQLNSPEEEISQS